MRGEQRLVSRHDLADLVEVPGRLKHAAHVLLVLLVSLYLAHQLRPVSHLLLRLLAQTAYTQTPASCQRHQTFQDRCHTSAIL